MPIEIVFETHARTEDNENAIATGWLDGRLSSTGRELAAEMGERRREDGIAAVFSSDLGRARETVGIAFSNSPLPILFDWRLRECDYGIMNGAPAKDVHGNRIVYLETPYPGGESWQQATDRIKHFLDDLALRWEGTRLLVVGHVATRLGLERWVNGADLADLLQAEFVWQEGWQYGLE